MEKKAGGAGVETLATYVGIACVVAALGARVSSSNPCKVNLQWEADKRQLVRKIDEALAEVEEMKKRRSEDAKANDKVAAMFAARTQQWKTEKNQLRKQVEILLSQSQALETLPSYCSECTRKEEAIADLEAKSLQLDKQLVRAFDRIESCERDRKIISEENEEVKERLVKLQEDVEEKGEIISSLLRKSEEKEELGIELAIVETKRKQGDWTGLEKSLHAAHIKQRHLQELDAFERQMRAKDERMEAFRQKLLAMENMTENLKTENEDLARNLEQSKVKMMKLEALLKDKDLILKSVSLEAKNRAFCPRANDWQEIGNAKNKQLKVANEAATFSGVHEGKYEQQEFRSLEMIERERHYEKRKERLRSLLVTNESMPKTYLDGSVFVGKHRLYCEEMDHILPVEDVHLEYLIEEATQAFNSGCKLTALEGARKTIEKPGLRSFPHQDVSETEINHPEDFPIVVDKHVSETLEFNQTEAKIELQPGLGLVGEWQKGRATSLADTESQIAMPKHNRQLQGKTVNRDNYLTYKKPGTTLEIVYPGKEPKGQITEQSTPQLQTVPGASFLGNKDDDLSFGSQSYLKHILQGRGSFWKEAGVLEVSFEVKSLEQELLQLEKIAKTEVSKGTRSKDGKSITNIISDNGNENQQIDSNHIALSAIRLLKKQVKRYQALIGKIDDLCKRMHHKDPVDKISGTRTREQVAVEELILMETFQLQHYVVAMGQKLMTIQSEIARNSCSLNNDLVVPANFNMRQSIVTIKSNLKEIQRSLEIKLARIIGDLEGTLARDGILHVMPVEWKKESSAISGKNKKGSHYSKVKQ